MKNNEKLSWLVFDNWQPIKQTNKIINWDCFYELEPFFNKLIDSKYDKLLPLLEEWDKYLKQLGKDPTNYNWDNFRPLRVKNELDWSDWFAHLIANSTTGVFCKNLLNIQNFETNDYSLPIKAKREEKIENYQSDLIIHWKADKYTHIEVKIGDENLEKTFVASEIFRKKYNIKNKNWTNYILLLDNQLNNWQKTVNNIKSQTKIKSITWKNVSIALRNALLSDENIAWKVWAYTFTGAIEQKLIKFNGYKIQDKPTNNIDMKIEILEKGLKYE